MATVALDDSDPIDAIALAYREEMKARESEGGFWGSVASRATWQHGKPAQDTVTTERHRKRVASPPRTA